MTGGKATRPVKNQRMLRRNDNMRTHLQAVLVQSGAYSPAIAKPEKKNKIISSGAKRDILRDSLAGGGASRGNWGRRSKVSID